LKLLSFLVALVGVLWLGIAGGVAVWWWDERPAGVPAPVHIHWLLFNWTLPFPPSLRAERDAALLSYATLVNGQRKQAMILQAKVDAAEARADASEKTAAAAIAARVSRQTKEVPDVVTPTVDRSYPLPVGLVRVHDAAALGVELSSLPAPAGLADDAPDPAPASALADVIVANYGACASTAQRLTAIQDYVRVLSSLSPPPPVTVPAP
jgi:hypothetical protein